jgi:hypothetical protein
LVGGSTISEIIEFQHNRGTFSIHIDRNENKPSPIANQFTISQSYMHDTPPLRFYNSTGALAVNWNGEGSHLISAEPAIAFVQPISVLLYNSSFYNFASDIANVSSIVSVTLTSVNQPSESFGGSYSTRIQTSSFYEYVATTWHMHALTLTLTDESV